MSVLRAIGDRQSQWDPGSQTPVAEAGSAEEPARPEPPGFEREAGQEAGLYTSNKAAKCQEERRSRVTSASEAEAVAVPGIAATPRNTTCCVTCLAS